MNESYLDLLFIKDISSIIESYVGSKGFHEWDLKIKTMNEEYKQIFRWNHTYDFMGGVNLWPDIPIFQARCSFRYYKSQPSCLKGYGIWHKYYKDNNWYERSTNYTIKF